MVDLEIDNHFVALQQFILLQDGEFGQSLSDQLFNKVEYNNYFIVTVLLIWSFRKSANVILQMYLISTKANNVKVCIAAKLVEELALIVLLLTVLTI